MSVEVKWLGHGSWLLTTKDHKILLDPFLDQSPTAPCKAAELQADFILVSHGHFDHVADVASIANRCAATVVGVFEIAEWFRTSQGVENTLGMNVGGGVQLPFGHVKATPAWHSSQLPDGSYGGTPIGYVVSLPDCRIYFACDTGLFDEMVRIGKQGIDLAVVPIGDLFTMGPDDSIEAIRMIEPRRVLPAHYNTWPPIEQDAIAWAKRVELETKAEPCVLRPGEALTL